MIDGELHLKGLVASPDGQKIFRCERKGKVSEATEIGKDAGLEIRQEAGEAFFQEMQAGCAKLAETLKGFWIFLAAHGHVWTCCSTMS